MLFDRMLGFIRTVVEFLFIISGGDKVVALTVVALAVMGLVSMATFLWVAPVQVRFLVKGWQAWLKTWMERQQTLTVNSTTLVKGDIAELGGEDGFPRKTLTRVVGMEEAR